MTKANEAVEAEKAAKAQRFAGLARLRINENLAGPAAMAIYAQMKACQDADALDKFLAYKAVVMLFHQGVLFFGDSP